MQRKTAYIIAAVAGLALGIGAMYYFTDVKGKVQYVKVSYVAPTEKKVEYVEQEVQNLKELEKVDQDLTKLEEDLNQVEKDLAEVDQLLNNINTQ